MIGCGHRRAALAAPRARAVADFVGSKRHGADASDNTVDWILKVDWFELKV